MRVLLRIVAVAGAAATMGLVAISAWPIGETPSPIPLQGDVQRGAYLARASGCIACHTNVEAGGAPLAGGVEVKTPFGTLVSPNITPDAAIGIGGWSVEDFARALRQGISPSGEPYYPAFPYPFYAGFSDQEIADLWAAFQTVAPVAEPASGHDLRFPFDQRFTLKLWRAAFLHPPRSAPVAGKGDTWNRGRALVEGAAHCGACHTGRNLLGARDLENARFRGNPDLPGGNKAPPIDPATLRKRGWTVPMLTQALATGLMPDGDAFGGGMGEVVLQGTRFLTEADRHAVATYLMNDTGAERPKESN